MNRLVPSILMFVGLFLGILRSLLQLDGELVFGPLDPYIMDYENAVGAEAFRAEPAFRD